eukprot:90873_1
METTITPLIYFYPWQCNICTFENDANNTFCVMCEASRWMNDTASDSDTMYSSLPSNHDAEIDISNLGDIRLKHAIWKILDSENIKVTETTTLTLNDFLLYHSSLVQSTTLLNAFLLLIG